MAIYTGGEYGAWAALRQISIRANSRFNWLCPINFLTKTSSRNDSCAKRADRSAALAPRSAPTELA